MGIIFTPTTTEAHCLAPALCRLWIQTQQPPRIYHGPGVPKSGGEAHVAWCGLPGYGGLNSWGRGPWASMWAPLGPSPHVPTSLPHSHRSVAYLSLCNMWDIQHMNSPDMEGLGLRPHDSDRVRVIIVTETSQWIFVDMFPKKSSTRKGAGSSQATSTQWEPTDVTKAASAWLSTLEGRRLWNKTCIDINGQDGDPVEEGLSPVTGIVCDRVSWWQPC